MSVLLECDRMSTSNLNWNTVNVNSMLVRVVSSKCQCVLPAVRNYRKDTDIN